MGRPLKTGLIYFTKDVDYYDDFKIMDLMIKYGPLGQTIYDILLTIVYHEGYYLAIPIDKLAVKVIKIIGNRWVNNKEIVVQVIQYCADVGLLDKDLLNQNVITSVGIQKRYAEATVRRQSNIEEYWLLDKEKAEQPLLNAPKTQVNVTKTQVNVTETNVIDSNNAIKKSKVNNSIYKNNSSATKLIAYFSDNEKLNKTFLDFMDMRKSIKAKMTDKAIILMVNKIKKMNDPDTAVLMLEQSIMNSWKDIYPLKQDDNNNNKRQITTNKFNQFPQRPYTQDDYIGLESRLLQK